MTKNIYQADAIAWLNEHGPMPNTSIITSLPDVSEFHGASLDEWKKWFIEAAVLVLKNCDDDGVTIFYQSDIKKDGIWIDKGFLVQTAAEIAGHQLLAHKIICRRRPGIVSFGRPAYSHLLCFSKNVRVDIEKSFMDVLPDAGETTWTRGMGLKACELAIKMVQSYTKSQTILDPFCGHGAVLALANKMGFHAVGIDQSAKCVRKTQNLTL